MLGDLKVLLIDDDQDYRAAVRSVLESRGCAVYEAESGKSGLKMLAECHPDVVLLDVMMDYGTDGYSVNQTIKHEDTYAAFRDVPIIMVSSIQQSPDELFPMASEVDLIRPDIYLTKPLDIPKLFEVLEKATARLSSRGVSAV